MNKETLIKSNLSKTMQANFWDTIRELIALRESNGELNVYQQSLLKIDYKILEYCDTYIVEGTPIKIGDLVNGTLGIQKTVGGKTCVRVFNNKDEETYRKML